MRLERDAVSAACNRSLAVLCELQYAPPITYLEERLCAVLRNGGNLMIEWTVASRVIYCT
jgi:hypothetical protein